MKLDGQAKASIEDSKRVVAICTRYAQAGMFNIFLTIFFITLAAAFADEYFFIGYLIGIALSGLFQAIFMANAGGAWDNAKKIVETELHAKGTPLHDATVVGDTVGDPFKDTSSVAMNPIIKFATLFGLLAVELAITPEGPRRHTSPLRYVLAAAFFLVAAVLHLPQLLRHADRGNPHRPRGGRSRPGHGGRVSRPPLPRTRGRSERNRRLPASGQGEGRIGRNAECRYGMQNKEAEVKASFYSLTLFPHRL